MQKTKNGFRFEFELFLWHTRAPSVGYMTSTLRKPHEKATMHDFDIKRAQCAYARRFKDFAQNMHQYTSKQELWYQTRTKHAHTVKNMILLWNVQKQHAHTPKKETCFAIKCEENMHSWTQNQWFWILCRPIIYIYIDSKVIYVPLFEYIILRTLDIKHWKYSF